MNRQDIDAVFNKAGWCPLPASMSVPQAGWLYWGLDRVESYAAAQQGWLPCVRVGVDLRVPTHQVLEYVGWSPSDIAYALGVRRHDLYVLKTFVACVCHDELDPQGLAGLQDLTGFDVFCQTALKAAM